MNNKERFNELLLSTKIKGIDNLIIELEKGGFYTSPASSGHHLAEVGGLLQHSLNVYNASMEVISQMNIIKADHVDLIIATLLHDVGKMGAFGEANYVPNVLKSGNVSTAKPFVTTKIGLEHQDISIMTVNKYIDLNRQQTIAIKYHNGLYTADGRDIKGNETPLYLIVHFADMWASRVMEG